MTNSSINFAINRRFFLDRVGHNIADSPSICREDKLLLAIVKIKCDYTFSNLAAMFGIGQRSVKEHFDEAFWALYSASEDLVIWFNSATIRARMPPSFRACFPKTRAIIGTGPFIYDRKAGAVRLRIYC